MNTKNNLKSQETKKKIGNILVKLLAHKSISNISISEICDLCHVNRSTFYRHYRDIYDLYNQFQSEMMKEAHEACFAPVKEGYLPFSRTCFQCLFQHILDHSDYYSNMVTHIENAKIVDFLLNRSQSSELQPLIQMVKMESSEEESFRLAYFDGGLNAIIRHWIETGYSVTPKDLAYFMEKEYQYEVAKIEETAFKQKE